MSTNTNFASINSFITSKNQWCWCDEGDLSKEILDLMVTNSGFCYYCIHPQEQNGIVNFSHTRFCR